MPCAIFSAYWISWDPNALCITDVCTLSCVFSVDYCQNMKGGKETLRKSEVFDFRHKKIQLQYNFGEPNKRILFSEDLLHRMGAGGGKQQNPTQCILSRTSPLRKWKIYIYLNWMYIWQKKKNAQAKRSYIALLHYLVWLFCLCTESVWGSWLVFTERCSVPIWKRKVLMTQTCLHRDRDSGTQSPDTPLHLLVG